MRVVNICKDLFLKFFRMSICCFKMYKKGVFDLGVVEGLFCVLGFVFFIISCCDFYSFWYMMILL